MTAQQPTELWSQRTYTRNAGATRVFIAPGYASAQAAEAAVIGNFGVQPGAPHPDDQYMFVSFGGTTCRNVDGPTTWAVTVPYTPLQQAGGSNDPTQREAQWEFSIGLEPINVDVDRHGNPITNSAGTPVEPAFSRTINTLQLTATRYYPNFSLATALAYMNKVNAGPVQVKSLGTVPAGCMKCIMICPTHAVVLTKPAPIKVLHRFEIRGKLVSGQDVDPAFALRFIDKGYSGWYRKNNVYHPGDFSARDNTLSNGTTNYYSRRSEITMLDGYGRPLASANPSGIQIRIGEGKESGTPQAETPVESPENRQPDKNTVVRKATPFGVALIYEVEDRVDFGPLVAAL